MTKEMLFLIDVYTDWFKYQKLPRMSADDLLQFTSQYVDNIIDRSVEYDDDLIIEENEEIIDIHDFLCECKHKRLTLSPNEHIGAFSLEQMEEFNNATN